MTNDLDLEVERIAILAEMEKNIDPELLKILEEMRQQPEGTEVKEFGVFESEGTVYAGS